MMLINCVILFSSLLFLISNTRSENKYQNRPKKSINKCCPEGKYVQLVEENIDGEDNKYKLCVAPKWLEHYKLDFREVLLYNKNKTKTGKNVKVFYDLVPGVMTNDSFNVSSYDYTIMGHNYYLSEDSVLYEEIPNQFNWWTELSTDRFCIDYQLNSTNISIVLGPTFWTVIENENLENPKDSTIVIGGLITSCIFLILVLLVYCLLATGKNHKAKERDFIHISYVICNLVSFLFLVIILWGTFNANTCLFLSYTTYYFLLANFCWMVIMSYDLWWINSYIRHPGKSNRKLRSRFRWYKIFGWGLPTALTTILVTTNHVDLRHMPWFTKPNIPSWGCFIYGKEKLLYLYIPMMILLLANWVFFILTSVNLCYQYKITSAVDMNHSTRKDHRSFKNRFLLYLKLTILMGLSWVLEVASTFNPTFDGWKVSDFYNTLVGFSVFLVMVCNKRTFKQLKERLQGHQSAERDSTETDQATDRHASTTEMYK